MRIVLDTNILVSATQWPASSAVKTIKRLREKGVSFFVSEPILEEFQEVLCRDFDYSSSEASAIVFLVLRFASVVEVKSVVSVVRDDPDDDKVLACAVDSSATHIISYDRHLLRLGTFKGIKIVKPEELRE